jgi:predicted metallopeptidase
LIKYLIEDEVKSRVEEVVKVLGWSYIDTDRVFCIKSMGSKSKYVHARCYSFPRVLQKAFNMKPHYIIEVIGKYYDELSDEGKYKLVIHELLHIPYTFSGALRNHKGSGRRDQVTKSVVNKCYEMFKHGEKFDVSGSKRTKKSINYFPAPSIKSRINRIVETLGWSHISKDRVICFESKGSKKSFPSRFHELPRIWQEVLGLKPHYIIEVLSKNFYKFSSEEMDKWLIKELLYIPKSFSGALRPHKGYVSTSIVEKHYNEYLSKEGLSWV